MAQKSMYPAKPNSPITLITLDITADQTDIPVGDVYAFIVGNETENIAVIGTGGSAETIRFSGVDIVNSLLTGCERGVEGWTDDPEQNAQAWETGTQIARLFTVYDHNTFKENIEDLDSRATDLASTVETITDVIDGIDTDITSIENEVSGIKYDITVLQTTDTGLQENINTVQENADTIQGNLDTHTADIENPHQVTAEQVGNVIPQWNADKIQGIDVSTTPPVDEQVMVYDEASNTFIMKTIELTGDAITIQGVPVDVAAPNHGEALVYDSDLLVYRPSKVTASGGGVSGNIDGGFADSQYLTSQEIDGGSANVE